MDFSLNNYISQENIKLQNSFSSLIKSLEALINFKEERVFISAQPVIDYKSYWLLFIKNFLVWISLKLLSSVKVKYFNSFASFKNQEHVLTKMFYNQIHKKLHNKIILENFVIIKVLNVKFVTKELINFRNWTKVQNYKF